jgi:hypothetical protein
VRSAPRVSAPRNGLSRVCRHQVMLNIEGSEKGLSYPEFVNAMDDCLRAVNAVTTGSRALDDAMQKLKDRIKANNINMAEVRAL